MNEYFLILLHSSGRFIDPPSFYMQLLLLFCNYFASFRGAGIILKRVLYYAFCKNVNSVVQWLKAIEKLVLVNTRAVAKMAYERGPVDFANLGN